ncbi:MAG: bifunctional aspartate kinase/homoserine dehydrogenase I [Patescibacteria group bacterium]
MRNEKVKTKIKSSKFTKVLKFGGSSVGSAERIKNVCKIIFDASKKDRIAAVVSAMQGVTDKLLALDFMAVREKHLTAAKELKVPAPEELLNGLEKIIEGVKLLGDASPMAMDLIASFGERLSANLVSSYLNEAPRAYVRGIEAEFSKAPTLLRQGFGGFSAPSSSGLRPEYSATENKKNPSISVDSRELIKTDNNFQNADVNFKKTNPKIRSYFNKLPNNSIPVITGFIGSTDENKTTTLGRGGSDYSASIFGAALGVNVIEIWTDANGVMSADPRIAAEAITLPKISYEEAFEMAYFGAKVIHPETMVPAIKKNIPILVKNTFNPEHPGTLISKISGDARTVKNISAIDGISLINIGGTNLAGVPGTAGRVFKAVASHKVNVILIAQASSEHTICLAVNKNEAEKAMSALRNEFSRDIGEDRAAITKKDGQSILAIVGEKMRGTPGIAGKIFSSLGNNGINVSAIAQGGSERNVSFVVDQNNKNAAINCLHKTFFAPQQNRLGVFLLGTGNVGGETLKQMTNDKLQMANLKVYGIADIDKMVFDKAGIDLNNWRKILRQSPDKMNLEKFLEAALQMPVAEKIFVDCTASEKIAKSYAQFIKAGFHIVTPNKKANVLPLKNYQLIRKALAENQKQFHYDANVGAGLPIIETVKKLVATGDKIKKIEGIFSGTLSYLFNNYDGKRKFSDLVQEAKEKGYTEPDPREDLSGQDVGRKLLILAREMGLPAEFADVKLENLVKPDGYFEARVKKAKSKKCVLRYVGAVNNGKLSASLKDIPIDNPLAGVTGADNVVAIYSQYYKNPVVIKGAGAGAAVTAATVLNGILKIHGTI